LIWITASCGFSPLIRLLVENGASIAVGWIFLESVA
jgi:hypothetical protein